MELMTFWAQIIVGGELTTKQCQFPRDFAQWRTCWRVFWTTMLRLDASPPGPPDTCAEGIRQLHSIVAISPWWKTESVPRGGRF